MADPLGIASSVVALVGLCLQTVQGVQKLLADVKDVPKDLEKLKVEIDELSRYLHLLTSTTSGLGNEDRQWGDNGAIETSIEHCDTTKRTLSASTEHLKSRNNRFEHYWKARKDAIIKCLLELQAQPYSVCVAVQGNNNWKKDADEVSFINARHQGIGWGSNLLRSVKRNRMLYPFLRLLGMEYLTADKRPLSPLEKCVLETQPGELPHKANLNAEANLGIARQVKANTFPIDLHSHRNLPTSTILHAVHAEESMVWNTVCSEENGQKPLIRISEATKRMMDAEASFDTESSFSFVSRKILDMIIDSVECEEGRLLSGQKYMKRTGHYAVKIVAGSALCASALTMSQYDSSHSGPSQQMRRLSRAISKFKSIIRLGFDSSDDWMVLNTLCTSPWAVGIYDKSPNLRFFEGGGPSCNFFNLTTAVVEAAETGPCSPSMQIPDFLRDPSSTAFFDAAMALGISAIVFYLLHRSDSKQNIFVLVNVSIGSLSALCVSWMRGDSHYLSGYLPWILVFALIGSAIAHQIGRILQPFEPTPRMLGPESLVYSIKAKAERALEGQTTV